MTWIEVVNRLNHQYGGERQSFVAHTAAAMTASGIAASETDAAPLANRWYECWLSKAADELWFLDDAAALAGMDIRGLPNLLKRESEGTPVLLVGAHFGAHTLAWVRLDQLGVPMTILVHESMLSVVHNYGLRHATWLTPRQGGFVEALRTARPGSVFVTYADIAISGRPLLIKRGHFAKASPAVGILRATGAKAYLVDFTGERSRNERQLKLTFHKVDSEAGHTIDAWLDDALAKRAEDWMLWRRVVAHGLEARELAWYGRRSIDAP